MASSRPARKVVASTGGAGVGTALGEIVVWVIEQWIDLPTSIEVALVLLVATATAFAAGYATPPSQRDVVID